MHETEGTYYYLGEKKIRIKLLDEKLALSTRSDKSKDLQDELRNSEILRNKKNLSGDFSLYDLNDSVSNVQFLVKDIVSKYSIKPHTVYENEQGQILIDNREIICKFKSSLSDEETNQIEREFELKKVERVAFSNNVYVFHLKDGTGSSSVEIANNLSRVNNVEYAYPNFIEEIGYRGINIEQTESDVIRPSDPYFQTQWHLENTGQIMEGKQGKIGADIKALDAWKISMGDPNVILAVIDGGVDIYHMDLNIPSKIVSPIDLMADPVDTNPLGRRHGTEVAGMAVAIANNQCGGCGIAPNCKLMPIKANDISTQLTLAKGFVYAAENGADVITCSLGPNGKGWELTPALKEAFDYVTTFGRSGLGCVYIQGVDNNPLPINIDRVSSYENSISVGRTNNLDLYDGSAFGEELDLCAPGKDVLTITNGPFDNSCSVITETGTSYSAPLVAGAACLILSVNPDLSWQQVRQILLDSCDKINESIELYNDAPSNRPKGRRNDKYGYGRLNAHNAVKLAKVHL